VNLSSAGPLPYAARRRVVPARLLEAGFSFDLPEWGAAVRDLVARSRALPA
jgi:hypothetical protein